MKKIKIGQIGIGHNHGNEKMKTVRKFPELFEVVGYAEENEAWVEKRGHLSGYGGLPRMTVEELLEKCDAVLVETDVWDLTATAQKCIDAGKHIHMDKPAGGTLEEYKHLLDTAKEKNLVVQLGYMYRYNPAVVELLQRIKDGRVGEIHTIHAEMNTAHKEKYRRWLCNFGGGIMYILGSHMIDLIVYILGKPKKVHSFLKHSGMDGIDFADNNFAVLEYDKALARVGISSLEVNGVARRQFVVAGSEATACILPMEDPVTMTWAEKNEVTKAFVDCKEFVAVKDLPDGCRYDDMILDFYAYIMGTKENPFTYEHEYAVQEVLDEVVGGVRFHGKDIG